MAFKQPEITEWEHDHVILAKRVTDVGSVLHTKIDEVSTADVVYVGKAPAGLAVSSTGWLLEKIDTSTTIPDITHANDSWDNRVTANYS